MYKVFTRISHLPERILRNTTTDLRLPLRELTVGQKASHTGVPRCGNTNWRRLDELRFEFSEPPRSIEVAAHCTAYFLLIGDMILLAVPARS